MVKSGLVRMRWRMVRRRSRFCVSLGAVVAVVVALLYATTDTWAAATLVGRTVQLTGMVNVLAPVTVTVRVVDVLLSPLTAPLKVPPLTPLTTTTSPVTREWLPSVVIVQADAWVLMEEIGWATNFRM